jgi:hypothetical protein
MRGFALVESGSTLKQAPVCVFVCVCVCVCVCCVVSCVLHVCVLHVCVLHVCVCARARTSVHKWSVFLQVRACVRACVCVCVSIWAHTFMYVANTKQ